MSKLIYLGDATVETRQKSAPATTDNFVQPGKL